MNNINNDKLITFALECFIILIAIGLIFMPISYVKTHYQKIDIVTNVNNDIITIVDI